MFAASEMGRGRQGIRAQRLAEFFEAAYDVDADDEDWLANVLQSARAVWGRGGPAHGFIYDASDVSRFRMQTPNLIGFPDQAVAVFAAGVERIDGYRERGLSGHNMRRRRRGRVEDAGLQLNTAPTRPVLTPTEHGVPPPPRWWRT
jgi:hypothetical protein